MSTAIPEVDGNGRNLTRAYRIKTLESIAIVIVTVQYVRDTTLCQISSKYIYRIFPGKWMKYSEFQLFRLFTFIFPYFCETRVKVRPITDFDAECLKKRRIAQGAGQISTISVDLRYGR